MPAARYDTIGAGYSVKRQPDPRIARQIRDALGDARTVVNVGAGTGSYEPPDLDVTAVEPSSTMIAQRPDEAAPVIQASAESLPFGDNTFDAAIAVLTVHHWADAAKGMAEMRRVSRGPIVVLTFDPNSRGRWLDDYFPGLIALDDGRMPRMEMYGTWLGQVNIEPVPIPHDCTDGFLYAYWRRPEAYLDPQARVAMSSFAMLGDVSDGVGALERDLESGAWAEKYGEVLEKDALDCGYRLVRA